MSEEMENELLPDLEESVVAVDEAKEVPKVQGAEAPDLGLIMEVPLRLSVELGSANLPVRDVLALTKGSVVELDRMNGDPADVYVNDRLIARGEITVQDDRVAIRITELLAVAAKSQAG